MSLAILGLGTALPTTAVTQDESVGLARNLCCRDGDNADVIPNLYRQSSILKRHLAFDSQVIRDVLDDTNHSGSVFLPQPTPNHPGPTTAQRMRHYAEHAAPLALEAARQALARAEVLPRSITHLVTVTCTGFGAPGVDVRLMKQLGLSATVQRVQVGFMGCHGAINGLRVARGLAADDTRARVLLCAVELCGLHYAYRWDPKKMVANALFADGAAAAVGVQGTQPWTVTATGSCLFPDSEYAMTWDIGDHGFTMSLSTKVPDLIARNLPAWLDAWLDQQGLARGDVASWAVHPGGPRILTAVEQALGLDPTALAVSREILSECGNMSSPTVLFILDRLRQRKAPLPCVVLAFGPGLVAEAALVR